MGETCSIHGLEENAFTALVRKHEGRKSFKRPRHRWDDNIKIVVK